MGRIMKIRSAPYAIVRQCASNVAETFLVSDDAMTTW
jgi:hypothetical protein